MKSRIFLCIFGVAMISGASQVLSAAAEGRVTVSAEADPAYVEARKTDEGLREETYVFAEGEFFAGEVADDTLHAIKFAHLAKPLAYGLAERNYFPIKDQAAADLLITVHWGVTAPADFDEAFQEDLMEQTQEALENQNPDPLLNDYGLLNQLSAVQDNVNTGIDQEVLANARLLGYLPALMEERERMKKRGRSGDQSRVAKALEEERFFIVLMAWDNQALRNDGERKLRWVTRCNLPALGNRFAEAVPALIRTGSKYYGQHLRSLETEVTHLGPGRVHMPQPEVIEVEE